MGLMVWWKLVLGSTKLSRYLTKWIWTSGCPAKNSSTSVILFCRIKGSKRSSGSSYKFWRFNICITWEASLYFFSCKSFWKWQVPRMKSANLLVLPTLKFNLKSGFETHIDHRYENFFVPFKLVNIGNEFGKWSVFLLTQQLESCYFQVIFQAVIVNVFGVFDPSGEFVHYDKGERRLHIFWILELWSVYDDSECVQIRIWRGIEVLDQGFLNHLTLLPWKIENRVRNLIQICTFVIPDDFCRIVKKMCFRFIGFDCINY